MTTRSVRVAVALGSNLGERRRNLVLARGQLGGVLRSLECSRLYETEPMYLRSQPRFLNACCTGRTALSSRELLNRLQRIERVAGRRRGGDRYGPRVLEIDLLLYGDRVIRGEGLEVPHPRMAERAFVMIPLAEIAGDWIHPLLDATIDELRVRVSDEGVTPYRPANCRKDNRIGEGEEGNWGEEP